MIPTEQRDGRQSKEADFNRCIRLEDDFSFRKHASQTWKIASVDLKTMKLTARLHRGEEPIGEPQTALAHDWWTPEGLRRILSGDDDVREIEAATSVVQ